MSSNFFQFKSLLNVLGLNYAVFEIWGGGGGVKVHINYYTLLLTANIILLNSPLSNIISESARFAKLLAKRTQKPNKLSSFSKKIILEQHATVLL